MSNTFRPMLATDADLDKLRFPLLASAKLDGVRAVVRDGVVYSRSNKPIPNRYVQEQFAYLKNFDGELIVGEPTSKTCYRDTVSHVMSQDKKNYDLRFYVFDHIGEPTWKYMTRYAKLDGINSFNGHQAISRLEQTLVADQVELDMLEEDMLQDGYEGLILRDPHAPYKMGRSTVKEGYLLKLKRFVDAEAVVIGFEERMHNGNEATVNELGRSKRSSHAAGKTGRGDLGALVVSHEGVEFNIGTGFDDVERQRIWNNRDSFQGQLAKFKYFPVGVKTAPRHPVFLGWRNAIDL